MPKIRLKNVQFGEQAESEMKQYVLDNAKFWFERTRNYRENVLMENAKT